MNGTSLLRWTSCTRALALTVLTVTLAGCANMSVDTMLQHGQNLVRSFSQEVSAGQQQAMGDESAALLLGAAPLVKNAALQRYVNQVGLWVALHAERDDIDWRFGIIDTDSINAFAAPAGYVFVTRGLMARLNDESELAGIFAHEIGHVLHGHYVDTMIKRDRVAALGDLATSTLSSSGNDQFSPLVNLSRGIYGSGLDKSDEYQADRIGVVLAARAGYDPYGLPRILQMYATAADEAEFELLFSTHPSAASRLQALSSDMGSKLDHLETSGIKDTAAFRRQQSAVKTKSSAKR